MADLQELTPKECKALRVALIFGDPALSGDSDETLESAKHKLRAIEGRVTPSPDPQETT